LAQAALQAAKATPAQIRRQGRTLRQIPARTRVHGEPAREILRVAEHGEGWGVPAEWA